MAGNSSTDIWIAGAFAAFTVDLIVYPLDTIKTRLQSPDYKLLYRNGADSGFNPAMFRGVYQGVGSVIIATLPSSGTFFTTCEGVKATLHRRNPELEGGRRLLPIPLVHAIASGTAELVSCAILTPAEVIKQNAQMVDNSRTDRPKVNATLQTLQRFRSNPLALWRGYAALAGRNLPFTALQFPMFEGIRARVNKYRDDKGTRTHTLFESGMTTALSAGAGGSVAAVVTTPIDVIKTRIMLSAAEEGSGSGKGNKAGIPQSVREAKDAVVDATGKTVESAKKGVEAAIRPQQSTSWQIGRDIFKEQGVKGLFRGGALRGVWTMIGSALYLGVYESGRIYLAQRRGEVVDEKELMG